MKKKLKTWNKRKEKKARFKRKLARLRKRGTLIYGGFIELDGSLLDIGFIPTPIYPDTDDQPCPPPPKP